MIKDILRLKYSGGPSHEAIACSLPKFDSFTLSATPEINPDKHLHAF